MDAGGDAGPNDDAGSTGDGGVLVTGIAPTHFILGGNDTVVPRDVAAPIRAYTLSGDTFTEAQVSAAGDGGFSFTVPSRPYLVGIGDRWLLTDATRLDLGVNRLGRPDKGPAPSAPTDVTLTANGLTAWDDVGDSFQLASESVGELGTLSGALASGATGCSNSSFTYSSRLTAPAGLDAARGDTAVISQVRRVALPTDAGTVSRCSGVIASGETGPIYFPAPSAALTVNLAALPPTSVSFDWQPMAWQALAADVHPAAQMSVDYVSVVGVPGGLGRGFVGYLSELLSCELADQPAGPVQVQYGNPKSSWDEVSENAAYYAVPVQLPAPATRGSVFAVARSEGPALLSGPLAPGMSPPRDLAIDAQPAQGSPLTVASTTPVVSWLAPRLGSPTHYRVTVLELYMATSGNRTRSRSVATVVVPAATLQVRLPPGVLVPGTSYSLRVGAAEATGGAFSPASSPWYDALERHDAEALTSQFLVGGGGGADGGTDAGP